MRHNLNRSIHSLPTTIGTEVRAPDGYRFSHIAGTVFENTNKPLRDWFKVTHLMLTSKKGMSSRQIWRYMGFGFQNRLATWRTALPLSLSGNMDKLGCIVEVDETFRRQINKHGKRGQSSR